MNRKLFGLILTVLALPAFASDYWVLGSYEFDGNAAREAQRLRNATGMDVSVAQTSLGGVVYNRVVLARDSSLSQQQIIDSTGIVPWTLYEGNRAVPRRLARASVPSRRVYAKPVTEGDFALTSTESVSKVPSMDLAMAYQSQDVTPPSADASYVDYCVQEANPKERELFCSDGMLRRVLSSSVN